jgi:nucleoside-diphosphate-sugar epimerase
VGGLYGPSPTAMKATREQAIQEMVRAALKREDAVISWPYGPTEILYGKDAAKGTVLAALKNDLKENLFHIGCSGMVSGDDIVTALKKQFPEARISLEKGGKPMPYPESRLLTDLSRASEQLGYEPDYPLDEALADYAQTLRKLEGL